MAILAAVLAAATQCSMYAASASVSATPRATASSLDHAIKKTTVHPLAPGTHVLTLKVQSRNRQIVVVVPANIATKRRALLLVYSGALDTAMGTKNETDFVTVAARDHFVVAFLQGFRDSWNDGLDDTPAYSAGVDDVAFTAAAIRKIEGVVVFDHSRITAVGFSNGALMVQFLGCRLANLLAGIVPVEGEMPTTMSTNCTPVRPVSVLEIHGTADSVFSYGGGRFNSVFGGGGTVLSAPNSVARWASLDQCATPPTTTTPNAGTSVINYAGCRARRTVSLLTIVGGTHQWPNDVGVLVAGVL